jgi:Cft2 family RNA processing exonuclease
MITAADAFPVQMLFYGVGQAEEGIAMRLQLGDYCILLDCGLVGLETEVDLVLCSHAHREHAEGLLSLHQNYPTLPIYASEVTAELLPLNWPQMNPFEFCQALPWRSPLELLPGLTVELFPSGHLPGAAAFLLTYQAYRVLYVGDFSLSNLRASDGLRLDMLRNCHPDMLIVSGGTPHLPHRRQQENQLLDRLDGILGEGRSVVMPMEQIGQGPELLFLLRSHHLLSGRDLDIWVDGALAQSCYLYEGLLPHLPVAIQNLAKYQALFWDQRVKPRVKRLMMDSLIDRPSIVLVDANTDYRNLLHGNYVVLTSAKHDQGELYELSSQADRAGMLQLIHSLRPQYLVLVHGELEYLWDLAALEELGERYKVHVPMVGQEIEFALDSKMAVLPPPETRYEGEVAESLEEVILTLPSAVMGDERWRSLSDTGMVQATWEGDALVIRGLSARDLRGMAEDFLPSRSCYRCRFYRGEICREDASPLFGRKVSPEGSCGEFHPV